MKNAALLAAGGFFGSVARFALAEWIPSPEGFPFATLLINGLGCLFLGWFYTRENAKKKPRPERLLLIGTGFTGSFTTFSTFSLETVQLFQSGAVFLGILYLIGNLSGICMAALGVGLASAKRKEEIGE
ncbi:fluoride efflux transporter CrcB [Caldibacillus debilis]|uniref:Fluoride-specific ion channel FluC n=1 Tax=Caldibacillus debilis GB1 TaxID=1339248 RepID=A0A420VFZ8_9BACI|nr:fluoride efflux transporter CrcB [Caldibacillus debilis]RKO62338.1 camphor resistance protein CrcB [Caldibacillus debilis GB1]